MTGFTTHGIPISATAASNSSRVSAKRYGDVGNPRVSAASLLMPSLFIVSLVALAVGTTLYPSASSSTSLSVAIASISGII